ncbi:TPA: Panacea domain-containing protein [Neisseria subflava]|nr:type II toxin-antitoxin system antitoxin SocA domain-containing protein [uncultured Neisseria sp.]MBF1351300.1 DUF4065 domain-containing protein [Neisseria lactamica]
MGMTDKLNEVQALIIKKHREKFAESPTPMKLQKLCYYSQALSLGSSGKELFEDEFEAWQHGPVNRDLYQQYKGYQWRSIDSEIGDDFSNLSEQEQKHVEKVVDAFGRFDGAALSTMTHREDPWLEARGEIPEDAGSSERISKESMKVYFERKLKKPESE